MESDATDGGLSMGGILLAVFCLYLLGSRIARLYMFEQTGSIGRRARPVAQVVVLGDIGRSPRIRYHATSLADAGCTVDLIGYTGKYQDPGLSINGCVSLHLAELPLLRTDTSCRLLNALLL